MAEDELELKLTLSQSCHSVLFAIFKKGEKAVELGREEPVSHVKRSVLQCPVLSMYYPLPVS